MKTTRVGDVGHRPVGFSPQQPTGELHPTGGDGLDLGKAISWAFDTGLAWQGFSAGRPQDVAAIGFTHAQHSRGYAHAVRDADPLQPRMDYEQVLEVSYRIQLSDNVSVQPDLQYIRHPGEATLSPTLSSPLCAAKSHSDARGRRPKRRATPSNRTRRGSPDPFTFPWRWVPSFPAAFPTGGTLTLSPVHRQCRADLPAPWPERARVWTPGRGPSAP